MPQSFYLDVITARTQPDGTADVYGEVLTRMVPGFYTTPIRLGYEMRLGHRDAITAVTGCAAWFRGAVESMSFKALRVSGTEVELIFEGDDGTPVVHMFTVEPAHPPTLECSVVNGDADWDRYRRLKTTRWAVRLAAEAQRAAAHTIPAGETLKRLTEEARVARQAEWDATH